MPPPTARRAPYKDFLQPALQRRFASTAILLLGVTYIESVLLDSWNSYFWAWFPISITGFRTLFLSVSFLLIIGLRIGFRHVGIRTTDSPFETFQQNALAGRTVETIITYVICSSLFAHIYRWSAPESANLNWITYHSGDRARLNERAVFFTFNFVIIGIVEAVYHVGQDVDRLSLGVVQPSTGDATTQQPRVNPFQALFEKLPSILLRSVTHSAACVASSAFGLYWVVRGFLWAWTMSTFRLFINLPRSNIVPSSNGVTAWTILRSAYAGSLLCFLWAVGNAAFTLFLAKDPLKNGKPLTSESKDPNGSLLSGLRSKKPNISAFAMWELAYIARDFDARRKAIFEDIDRPDGPAWSQIYVICLNVIKSIEERVDNYGKAPIAAPTSAPLPVTAGLPKLSQPPKHDKIMVASRAKRGVRDSISDAIINSNAPGHPPSEQLGPLARKAVNDAKDAVLSKEQQQQLSADNINGLFQRLFLQILNINFWGIGATFQQTYRRRLAATVLGRPYGELSVPINAINVLTQLAVCSLTEDKYGNVARDVPSIIRTFTVVIKKLEKFRENLPVHWTDRQNKKDCFEVDELLLAFKAGLGRLITSFAPYSSDLRLNRTDMRLAREAADASGEKAAGDVNGKLMEKQPEMAQVR